MQTKYDVIVVGGGAAGFGAAVAAAREGADTLLIERNGYLGGACCDALVNPFMHYYTRGDHKRVNAGLFKEVQDRLGMNEGDNPYKEEDLKVVMETMCLEAGVHLLYHTEITGVTVDGGRICALDAYSVGKHYTFEADYFIDATGDANLAAMAGCGFDLGDNGQCQSLTLMFRLCNVDLEGFAEIRDQINERYQEDKAKGLITNPRDNVLILRSLLPGGVLNFNTTRIQNVDPTNPEDLTKSEIAARQQVYEMIAFLKRHFSCFANAELMTTAPRTGVRESRLVHGEYTLNEDDILGTRHFETSIARGAYCIDIHDPVSGKTLVTRLPDGLYYTIPYEACIPKGKTNLLMAGRCISSTHKAQAAYRIIPICCCIGEGVGAAAGLLLKDHAKDVRDVDIKAVQSVLESHGALY